MKLNQELLITVGGLASDPNPYASPSGSADICTNWWFPREGEASLRPAFGGSELTHTGLGSGRGFYIYFGGNPYYTSGVSNVPSVKYAFVNRHSASGANRTTGGLYRTVGNELDPLGGGGTVLEVLDVSSTSLLIYDLYGNYVEYDGNLYIPTQSGVQRIRPPDSSLTAPTAALAGMPQPGIARLSTAVTNGNDAVAASSISAYRITYELNVGDRVLQSPPSPVFFYRNASAVAQQPTFIHWFTSEADANWTVSLWKSLPVDLPVSSINQLSLDNFYLSSKYKITTQDLIQGAIFLVDELLYSDMPGGAELYTNPTVNSLGIAAAKYAPPIAKCLSEFNNMLFYGNVVEAAERSLSLTIPKQSTPKVFSLTSASTAATAVDAATTGFSSFNVGLWLFEDSVSTTINLTSYTYGFSENVLSKPAVNTISATTFYASGVAVGGFFYHSSATQGAATFTEDLVERQFTAPDPATNFDYAPNLFKGQPTGESLAYLVSRNTPENILVPTSSTFAPIHVSTTVSPSVFLQHARPGNNVSVSTVAAGNNKVYHYSSDSSTRTSPGTLYWSFLNEPEAVGLGNNLTVGDRSADILAFAKTRDSLFLFKEDGTWRITGTDPQSIAVNEFDRGLILLRPGAVCSMDNRIYAWTNQGIVVLDENGWESLSDPLIESLLESGVTIWRKNKDALYPTIKMRALPNHNAFVLAYADTLTFTPDYWLVYSTKTGQWSKWTFPSTGIVYDLAEDPYTGTLWALGYGNVNPGNNTNNFKANKPFLAKEKLSTDNYNASAPILSGNQEVYQVDVTSVATVSGNTYTLGIVDSNTSTTYVPAVGDAYYLSNNYWTVVSSVGLSSITVVGAAAPTTGTNREFVKSFTATWRSVPKSSQNPGLIKEWEDCCPAFSSLKNTAQVVVGMKSDGYDTSTTATMRFPSTDTVDKGRIVRTSISLDHAYNTEVQPSIVIKGAASQARLRGVSLTYLPISERVDSRE